MSDLDDLERRLFSEARREAPAPDLAQRILKQAAQLKDQPAHEAPVIRARARRSKVLLGFAGVAALAAAAALVLLSRPKAPVGDLTPRAEPASPARPTQASSARLPVLQRAPSPANTPPPKATKPVRPKQRSLAEQLEMLKLARGALRAGDSQRALSVLDEYAAGSNSTDMSAEASMLRIEALMASGKREQAQALAERFIARSPDNPLADRARALVSSGSKQVGMGRELDNEEKQESGE